MSFFSVRLWDRGNIVGGVLLNDDQLPDEFQAEPPLKRIWALVLEE
jgi:restriction system protein